MEREKKNKQQQTQLRIHGKFANANAKDELKWDVRYKSILCRLTFCNWFWIDGIATIWLRSSCMYSMCVPCFFLWIFFKWTFCTTKTILIERAKKKQCCKQVFIYPLDHSNANSCTYFHTLYRFLFTESKNVSKSATFPIISTFSNNLLLNK